MPFNLSAKFDMDGRGFAQTLSNSERQVKDSADRMAGSLRNAFSGNIGGGIFSGLLAGAGLGAVAGFAGNLADAVRDKFKEISVGSQLLQIDPQTFQRVKNVTDATAGSVETVAKGMEHIAEGQQKVKEGGEGSDKALRGFQELGISLADLQTKSFQDIFFKIAEGMNDAQVTGEKLVALKEILGRGGPELIPAFNKGFTGPGAEKGILDEEQLRQLQELKSLSAQTGGVWADMANNAGVFWEKIKVGLKSLPELHKIFTDRTTAGDVEGNVQAKLNEKIIKEKDAAKAAAQADLDRKAETARINAEFTRKTEEEEQGKALKDSDRMEEDLKKKKEEDRYNALSAADKKKDDQATIAKEHALSEEFAQRFRANPDDQKARKEMLSHGLLEEAAVRRLQGLDHGSSENPFKINDKLARIGGGFAQADQTMKTLAERTANATENIVRTITNAPTNPLS